MVEIVPYEKYDKYKGKKIISKDACNKSTVAVFTNGATMIPLCQDCLNRIQSDINRLN